jgi:hypothetical protein
MHDLPWFYLYMVVKITFRYKRTDAKLSNKCIPYLFFSTAINQKSVIDAYSQSVQGCFVKHHAMNELEKTITVIMESWRRCAAPNDFPE